ncbi:hypothetical protein [Eubacterium sp. 1001713B170207_170306_E7]|uniref:hypothetical protein n=1 Tax=Eubacterium sp. 1001713B170207_170306_E7 TaxID=2787097 RepID=UPI00189A0464|nr:hypothetical protein [Eubacterium sp. 1001713B170207_170306_E7]
MVKLLKLMSDGQARSVEELACQLNTEAEDIYRQMEFLEQAGYLRRVNTCGHDCRGCTANCRGTGHFSGMPVFWEVMVHTD